MEKPPAPSPLIPRWAIGIAVLLLAGAATFLLVSHGCAGLVQKTLPEIKISRAVNRTIQQSIADIRATRGDVLLLAEIETLETIRESDTKLLRVPYTEFDISVGTTESEVRIPAHYRYFVRLDSPIRAEIEQHGKWRRCVIHAPALEVQTPVGFDSNRMEIRVDAGWLRFNKDESREKVLKSISSVLETRAPQKIPLAQDKARAAFANFVRNWLLREQLYGDDFINDIIVLFPGETDPAQIKASSGLQPAEEFLSR